MWPIRSHIESVFIWLCYLKKNTFALRKIFVLAYLLNNKDFPLSFNTIVIKSNKLKKYLSDWKSKQHDDIVKVQNIPGNEKADTLAKDISR